MDKKLVSKQEHEISYLLRKWAITRAELLEKKGLKRSRKVVEKLLREAGYKTKKEIDAELNDQKFKTVPPVKKIEENDL